MLIYVIQLSELYVPSRLVFLSDVFYLNCIFYALLEDVTAILRYMFLSLLSAFYYEMLQVDRPITLFRADCGGTDARKSHY